MKLLDSRAESKHGDARMWREVTGKSKGVLLCDLAAPACELVNSEGVRGGDDLGLDMWAGLCSRKLDI